MADKLAEQSGIRIRQIRLTKDLTQEQLADAAKMTTTQVGRAERGEKLPNLKTLYKIANGLRIELSELIGMEHEFIRHPTNQQIQDEALWILQQLDIDQQLETLEMLKSLIKWKYGGTEE